MFKQCGVKNEAHKRYRTSYSFVTTLVTILKLQIGTVI